MYMYKYHDDKKSLGRCNKYNVRYIEHIFSYIKNDVFETRSVLEDAINTMLDILNISLVILKMMFMRQEVSW